MFMPFDLGNAPQLFADSIVIESNETTTIGEDTTTIDTVNTDTVDVWIRNNPCAKNFTAAATGFCH